MIEIENHYPFSNFLLLFNSMESIWLISKVLAQRRDRPALEEGQKISRMLPITIAHCVKPVIFSDTSQKWSRERRKNEQFFWAQFETWQSLWNDWKCQCFKKRLILPTLEWRVCRVHKDKELLLHRNSILLMQKGTQKNDQRTQLGFVLPKPVTTINQFSPTSSAII